MTFKIQPFKAYGNGPKEKQQMKKKKSIGGKLGKIQSTRQETVIVEPKWLSASPLPA